MDEDIVVRLPRPGGSVADDPLLVVLREGARRMLSCAIEVEGRQRSAAPTATKARIVRPQTSDISGMDGQGP